MLKLMNTLTCNDKFAKEKTLIDEIDKQKLYYIISMDAAADVVEH